MRRDVGIGNFIIFSVVVAIFLKGVEKEVGFSFYFSLGRAVTVYAEISPLKGCDMEGWVVAEPQE